MGSRKSFIISTKTLSALCPDLNLDVAEASKLTSIRCVCSWLLASFSQE